MTSPVNPGKVEWTGDNPGIYLKDKNDPQGPWTSLALFFNIVISPYGAGRGMVVLEQPTQAKGYPEVKNICLTNNEAMMRYLIADFAKHFPAFKDVPGVDGMSYHLIDQFDSYTDGNSIHRESMKSGDLEVELKWHGLQAPFAADVPATMTATKKHQMYSIFRGADQGEILVNGQALEGVVIERDFLDRRLNSAFFAYAESWVLPSEA